MTAENAIEDEHADMAKRPRQPVAPDTHPVERHRLATQERTHPSCQPLNVQLSIWVIRAYSAVAGQQAAELREHQLSPSSFNVLMALLNTAEHRLEPHEIAARLLVTRPSVTGLVDTLVGLGLVERRPHETDGRRVLVQLTDRARTLMHEHFPTHYANLNAQMSVLTDEEKATLVALLRKIEGAVPEHLAQPTDEAPDPAR